MNPNADRPDDESAPTPAYEEVRAPVLVVGAGAAGARTAIELQERGVEPLVVGKRDHGDAHTTWAAGGINAALGSLDPEDDWAIHAADTLNEGHFVNDPEAVELVAKTMPDRIRELDEWGANFDRTEDGKINQRYFGAQSFRRTVFRGDETGRAVLDALVSRAQELEVPYRENVMVTTLLSDGSRVYGAAGFDMEDGRFLLFVADHVVLAAGGFSAVYDRHSSRDDENTGDGPALAYDAGASLLDVEFVKFHPTGMVQLDRYDEDWSGELVTEAVRGEGGRLYNGEGERFMERYSPDQMELDARDVVARAIAQEIREGRGTEAGGVHLDISHRDGSFIRERLPKMYERFQSLGVDMAEDPVVVAPTAHYTMGGVAIDATTGETGVDRLYAVGETAAGVHGANRLGGNSLAETVAIAPYVGRHVAERIAAGETDDELDADARRAAEREYRRLDRLERAEGDVRPRELVAELRETMWEHAGILRDADRLGDGIDRVRELRDRMDDLRVEGDRTGRDFEFAVDLPFMLTAAEATLVAARYRTESRGAHFRDDHPETKAEWRVNVLVERDGSDANVRTRSVAEPSDPVREALAAGYELDYHHLE
ncbi:L-aspartate oxidase [Halopelagius longus]|uniref:FAD-dependent oxidoreductase n=1 Tax=Halopelagius longus TaxID=1236180 RepID=A0A1H0Y003_9EURY|nr:FAD-dependent oxidoreductase [Halopelagius longus]RDI72199.1 FAD-dependent oxidoreductase [Halopelagius longus]SDQ08482.1 succinate dehydrogenase subunit A [Halopelagius longus]